MKLVIAFACFCLLALSVALAADSEPVPTTMQPIESLPLDEGERAFEFIDGEADVNDQLIRRFAIGGRELTASYRNRGEEKLRPKYTARLYNAYGFLLGEDSVGRSTLIISLGNSVGRMEPGEVASEKLRVEWFPLQRIMAKSKVELPDDWNVVKWVVLTDANTSAEPEAAE